ncbi:ABC transporter ATP-binding protein [Carboxydochorda subterranea]|uniref:ABC transporter ATP-binding protein n=1 Tax=Carboxydichorda subterranea TaxID=3109565 RepID=A0ABZ1BWR2_9FIRM|nr:ABC transporter ATP-binding protein [Limnochorda sp. L945t]WRP16567.1 ABC transporter ATP-binding protein [Limnochorda sp. L945t]
MSVRENLDYFALLRGLSRRALRARRERLIEAFGLGPHADKEAHALSAGLRQRLATACALIQQAPLILLDEPTLGLDVESAAALESLLRELVARDGVTILLTSHELEMIQRVAERVIIIQSGEVVADAPVDELLALFRSRRYRCVVTPAAGRGPAPLPSDLEPVLAAPPRKNGEQWTLELDLGAPEQLFDCLAALRQSGLVIESVARDQPDLRQAYLRLVRGERAGAPAPLEGASGPAQAGTGREEAHSDG